MNILFLKYFYISRSLSVSFFLPGINYSSPTIIMAKSAEGFIDYTSIKYHRIAFSAHLACGCTNALLFPPSLSLSSSFHFSGLFSSACLVWTCCILYDAAETQIADCLSTYVFEQLVKITASWKVANAVK